MAILEDHLLCLEARPTSRKHGVQRIFQPQTRINSGYAFQDTEPTTLRRFRGLSLNEFSAGQYGSSYIYNDFEVISAWTHQTADTTYIYNESGGSPFSSVKTYTYGNPAHVQVTQDHRNQQRQHAAHHRMKYPADYATGSGNAEATAITAMKGDSAHMHSPVIERWVVEKIGPTEKVVSAELTSFKTYAVGQYLPYQRFALDTTASATNFVPSAVSGQFTKDFRYLMQETANTYDSFGRITQLADARSKLTNYTYGVSPNNAFLTRVTRVKDATGIDSLVTTLAYDGDQNLSSIKDEAGTFRYFTYDLYGRLKQIKNHGNTVVKGYGYTYSRTSPSWNYNPNSPNAVIDTTYLQQTPWVERVVTTAYFDGLGRPIQTLHHPRAVGEDRRPGQHHLSVLGPLHVPAERHGAGIRVL